MSSGVLPERFQAIVRYYGNFRPFWSEMECYSDGSVGEIKVGLLLFTTEVKRLKRCNLYFNGEAWQAETINPRRVSPHTARPEQALKWIATALKF